MSTLMQIEEEKQPNVQIQFQLFIKAKIINTNFK